MGNQEPVHLFLCPHGQMLPRWSEAFQGGKAAKALTTRPDIKPVNIELVWLRLEHGLSVAMQIGCLAPQLRTVPYIVLSDQPNDEEALSAFTAGARGYCNTHATVQVLVQVAAVVQQGGLWIGESLMQRLIGGTSRVQPEAYKEMPLTSSISNWAENLTDREKEVATTLSGGASNKEIAKMLGITERTVKAHVGAILEKLHVRDRLQLSLVVNRRQIE